MALAINKENFFLHKVHSLTGIVPVGYYMVQHLVLNSFTLAGPDRFDGVIGFFESIPKGALLVLEAGMIWLPLLFHAVYGMFIIGRAQPNSIGTKYGFSQNRMYTFQRWSGVFIFFFLIYHTATTTAYKYFTGNAKVVEYAAWQEKLTSFGYIFFVVYMLGVAASSYHLAYGVWNFAIRWGITISDSAQIRIQKFAALLFVGLTGLGWAALVGFLIYKPAHIQPTEQAALVRPSAVIPATAR